MWLLLARSLSLSTGLCSFPRSSGRILSRWRGDVSVLLVRSSSARSVLSSARSALCRYGRQPQKKPFALTAAVRHERQSHSTLCRRQPGVTSHVQFHHSILSRNFYRAINNISHKQIWLSDSLYRGPKLCPKPPLYYSVLIFFFLISNASDLQ